MTKRVASLWFPKLPVERVTRRMPVDAPFAVTLRQQNTERLYAVNIAAETLDLVTGMGLSDAKALTPELRTMPADLDADARFLTALARWAQGYAPWVNTDGVDGLVMDITGSTHLWDGEDAMAKRLRNRLTRQGITVEIGIADTLGTAWALARFDAGICPIGGAHDALARLPVAALRLPEKTVIGLRRLGLNHVGNLLDLPRVELTRRFGTKLTLRVDQALGAIDEPVSPLREAPSFAVRMNIPDPIGLVDDVMAALARVLTALCDKLQAHNHATRAVAVTLRRVDQKSETLTLRFARPMRVADEMLPLFRRQIDDVDAGFGIDQLRVVALDAAYLPMEQSHTAGIEEKRPLSDLITRIGNRVGFEHVRRPITIDTYMPDRDFAWAPVLTTETEGHFADDKSRPLTIFTPEFVRASTQSTRPPQRFSWRRMRFETAYAIGPERVAPPWWFDDDDWRSGVRDYWRIATAQGRRLWLFYTPQSPNWYVQGEFL